VVIGNEKQKVNYYILEVEKIKGICFSNKIQIDTAVKTKRYIDTNFGKEINLDLLAHLQCTSKYHLIRVFKKYYGFTLRQYLINKRIEKAKQYLKSGKSVSDTCYTIGFQSIHSFSTLFKAKTGIPPSIYRKATFDKSKI
jgi:AraC-like DNA-binding protein